MQQEAHFPVLIYNLVNINLKANISRNLMFIGPCNILIVE